MFFILLTFAAALSIEGLGSLVSVIGISALFGANPIIIALAIALDVGKIVVVSLLYTHWKTMGVLMKSYALIAAIVTMTITSAGAAGYLSGEFQKAIVGAKEGDLKVSVLKEQQARYQERKKQIDDQIASLPTRTTVTQRLRLINGFKAEQQRLDEQIAEIDKQLPQLQVAQIGTEAKAGPILYIAKAFDVPVEQAVKYVILLIIVVFDPLAVFLIIAGNYLWAKRKAEVDLDDDNGEYFEAKEWYARAAAIEPRVKPVEPQPVPAGVPVGVGAVEDAPTPQVEPIDIPVPSEPPKEPALRILSDEELAITPPPVEEKPRQSGLTSPVEVAHSSMHEVPDDPTTVVDAHTEIGWRAATSKKP